MGTDYSSYGGGILGGDIFTINIQNVKSMIDGIVEAGTIVRVVIDTQQTDWVQSPSRRTSSPFNRQTSTPRICIAFAARGVPKQLGDMAPPYWTGQFGSARPKHVCKVAGGGWSRTNKPFQLQRCRLKRFPRKRFLSRVWFVSADPSQALPMSCNVSRILCTGRKRSR